MCTLKSSLQSKAICNNGPNSLCELGVLHRLIIPSPLVRNNFQHLSQGLFSLIVVFTLFYMFSIGFGYYGTSRQYENDIQTTILPPQYNNVLRVYVNCVYWKKFQSRYPFCNDTNIYNPQSTLMLKGITDYDLILLKNFQTT